MHFYTLTATPCRSYRFGRPWVAHRSRYPTYESDIMNRVITHDVNTGAYEMKTSEQQLPALLPE